MANLETIQKIVKWIKFLLKVIIAIETDPEIKTD